MLKVFTVEEIAEVLRLSFEEAQELVESGEVQAFSVLGRPRVTEDALRELMSRQYSHGGKRSTLQVERSRTTVRGTTRRRDPEKARVLRRSIEEAIRKVAPSFFWVGRSGFKANANVGIVCLATMRSGPRNDYWMGFKGSALADPPPVYLVVAIPEGRFVVPVEKHRGTLEQLSESATGARQFHVDNVSGAFEISGKVGVPPLGLEPYRDKFDVFR